MGMMTEFKEFAMRGNVIDLAVGVVIGAAFGKIVTALVDKVMGTFLRCGGLNLAPFNAWVVLKGLETLSLRVKAEKILFATTVPTPAVNSSAALSPTIRPMDKMQPVTMPSTEEGRMMVRIMYHFVAPRPSAPSR